MPLDPRTSGTAVSPACSGRAPTAVATLAAVAAATLTACLPGGGAPGSGAPDGGVPSASASPTEGTDTPRAELAGVSLPLPDGWDAESVTEPVGPLSDPGAELEETEWLALYPRGQAACAGGDWSWGDLGTGCRHLKVLGPQVLDHGGPGYAPMDFAPPGTWAAYAPSSNPGACPEGVPVRALDGRGDDEDDWETATVTAEGGRAVRATGSVLCFDTAASGFARFDQRVWLLEGPDVIVVDGYGLDETEGLVSSARW